MKVRGLDWSNYNAEPRAIVIHNAWYAEDDMIPLHGKLGRSEGCFAMSRENQYEVMRTPRRRPHDLRRQAGVAFSSHDRVDESPGDRRGFFLPRRDLVAASAPAWASAWRRLAPPSFMSSARHRLGVAAIEILVVDDPAVVAARPS